MTDSSSQGSSSLARVLPPSLPPANPIDAPRGYINLGDITQIFDPPLLVGKYRLSDHIQKHLQRASDETKEYVERRKSWEMPVGVFVGLVGTFITVASIPFDQQSMWRLPALIMAGAPTALSLVWLMYASIRSATARPPSLDVATVMDELISGPPIPDPHSTPARAREVT